MDGIGAVKLEQFGRLTSINGVYKGDEKGNSYNVKIDILEISTQVEILQTNNNRSEDYAAIESKLGIDSKEWGVEAVSDDIFNFMKIAYEAYKLNHEGEDPEKTLKDFYEMAKSSITQGFEEAMAIVGGFNEDVDALSNKTFERTLEKLEAWFESGGVEPKENKNKEKVQKEKVVKNYTDYRNELKNLLDESQEMVEFVLSELEKQGVYLREKKEFTKNFDVSY